MTHTEEQVRNALVEARSLLKMVGFTDFEDEEALKPSWDETLARLDAAIALPPSATAEGELAEHRRALHMADSRAVPDGEGRVSLLAADWTFVKSTATADAQNTGLAIHDVADLHEAAEWLAANGMDTWAGAVSEAATLLEGSPPAPDAALVPDTPAVKDALSMMLWHCGSLAETFRQLGIDIKRRAEDEQAYVLRHCLNLAIQHGDNWRTVAQEELTAIRAAKTGGQS